MDLLALRHLRDFGFVFCWFLVPETKGKRLEQIEAYWKNDRTWPDQEDVA